MMLCCGLFWALFAVPDSGRVLEIQAEFFKPRVHWEDLNDDGHPEIWVSDKGDVIWVALGGTGEPHFEALTYDPIPFSVRPAYRQGLLVAQAYHEGVFYEFEPDAGWMVRFDATELAPIRQKPNPLGPPQRLLIPTFEGYLLIEDDCPSQTFKMRPAVSLSRGELSVNFPVLRWLDLNGDKREDLLGGPVSYTRQGGFGLWSGILGEGGWQTQWNSLQIEPIWKIAGFQLGDLNGDGWPEAVVLTRPASDMSIFEEMSFLIYLGKVGGGWESRPMQVLKTKQNLWQTGPVEVNSQGVFLYYYKGLVRSNFRIDRYRWNEAGYLEPKPVSDQWSLKKADRGFIMLDYDIDNKNGADLFLADEEGLRIYYRQPPSSKKLPFNEVASKLLFPWPNGKRHSDFDFEMGGEGEFQASSSVLKKQVLTSSGQVAFVADATEGTLSLWRFELTDKGHCRLIMDKRMLVHPSR